jgi:AcrR family transcriptional regulator
LLVDSKYSVGINKPLFFHEQPSGDYHMPATTERTTASTLTQAERTAISDRAMLDAAIELILEHGIEKTTLQSIGERAGYSRGLATYRFGSKSGLLDEVCKSISRNWLDYLKDRVDGQIGIDAMCTALDSYFEFISGHARDMQVLQILYGAAASPKAEFRSTSVNIHQRQIDDVTAWVDAGISQGSIRSDIEAASIAAQYIAYISGMTYLWLISPSTINIEKANDDMKERLKIYLQSDSDSTEGITQ